MYGAHSATSRLSDRKIKKAIVDLLAGIGSPASHVTLDELANTPRAGSEQFGAARTTAMIRLRVDLPISS
jgi:hypothetical protein